MDIQALKAVSSVAASPGERGRTVPVSSSTGKDSPPPPQQHAPGLDPVVTQQQQARQAAVAQRMNDFLRSNSRDLEFQVDASSGDAVLTVRDAGGNIVRRIPGEEALQMLRRLTVESGTFVDSMV